MDQKCVTQEERRGQEKLRKTWTEHAGRSDVSLGKLTLLKYTVTHRKRGFTKEQLLGTT